MVVAVKIPNPKAAGSKSSRVQGLAQYISEPERGSATEKCIYFGTRGFLSKSLPSQIAEMIALAHECVKSKDPIRHDVITFKEGESPTAKQVEEIIDLYAKEMGLQGHQIMFGLHVDTDNVHIHIQANRVHPETLKAVKIDRGFDKEALQRVCALIEHAQGWKPENNSRYRVLEDGRISDRPLRPERGAKPSPQAQGMETRTGIKSAERIVIEDATGILKSAKTWRDIHQRLEKVGIRYERSGGGALFFVGDVAVKASVVERGARFAALQKKLGPFEPQNQEKPNAYFIHKLDSERAAERGREAKEQDVGDVQYLAKNGMRRLSECRVAITSSNAQSASARVLQIDARTSRRGPEQLRRPESNASSRVDRSNEPLHDSLFRSRSGWHEYATARGEHYKNRRLDTEATGQRHAQEREALKAAQRVERAAALPNLRTGESRAGMTNVLRSLMKFDQAKAKLDLKERHAAERAALKVKYPQFCETYEQWLLDRGEAEKAQKWRYRENPDDEPCVIRGVTDVPAKKMDLRDFSGFIEGSHVRYVNRDGLGFLDRGRNIVVGDWRDESVTLAALQLSASKWGLFQVTGNDEYKALCVKLAAQHGFKINNPELQKGIQAQREQLDLLRQEQQQRIAAQQAQKAAQQRAVERDEPPVVQPVAAQQLEKPPPAPLAPMHSPIQQTGAAMPLDSGPKTPDSGFTPIDSNMKGLVTDPERELVQRIEAAIKANDRPELEACMDAFGRIRGEAARALAAVAPQEVNKAAIAHQVKTEQNAAAVKRGDPEPWYVSGIGSETGACAWDKTATEAATKLAEYLNTRRPSGMFKGAEGKAWDERSAQLAGVATDWSKAAEGIKQELASTTEQRVTKEAEAVVASNVKNASQYAKELERYESLAVAENRLETALRSHKEKERKLVRGQSQGR